MIMQDFEKIWFICLKINISPFGRLKSRGGQVKFFLELGIPDAQISIYYEPLWIPENYTTLALSI